MRTEAVSWVRHVFFLTVCLLNSALAFAAPVARRGEVVIIRTKDAAKAEAKASAMGINRIASKSKSRFERVLLPQSASISARSETTEDIEPLLDFCAKLKEEGLATHCSPNYRYKLASTTNDPDFSELYGMSKIQAPEAWDTTPGSSSVVVAVIDTGVQYNHPDLAANIWSNSGETAGDGIDNDGNGYVDDVHGYNWVSSNGDPRDDNEHGTHVAGTIGAVGNNGVGVSGVAQQVRIQCLKVLDAEGSGYTSDMSDAVNYAAANGASVINMSLGGPGYDEVFEEAIRSSGALVVVAAGNEAADNDETPSYPASYVLSNMITVAATDSDDNLADFSNYSPNTVHLAAPGVEIYSTLPGSTYGSLDGTSMATPHVAGAAALVKAANLGISVSDLRAALLSNVDVISGLSSFVVTGGRLNVRRAVASVTGGSTPTPRINPTLDGLYIETTRVGSRKYEVAVLAYDETETDYLGIGDVKITLTCKDTDGKRKSYSKKGKTDSDGWFAPQIKFTGTKASCKAVSGKKSKKLNLKVKK